MAFGLRENLFYYASKQVHQLKSHLGSNFRFSWLPAPKTFTAFGLTDIGLWRPNNEDVFVTRPQLGFSLVADGMGGAAAGEVASRLFMETALEIFSRVENQDEEETIQSVQRAFDLANERILAHVEEYPDHQGMGCTAELIAFSGEQFVVGHVGDSRTYRMRDGDLIQLTEDHSFVQAQLKLGFITPEEAKKHEMKNVILRAVGIEKKPEVDLVQGKVCRDDLFLLCSDGLTDFVEDSDIQKALSVSGASLQGKAERLVDLAKAAGGHDNITVVLIKI